MSEERSVLVLHAHPDDEVFRTAGIFAKYAAAGDRVVAVYATNGELGEMHDPDLDPQAALENLGEIRQEEARQACRILGVREVCFLGYRDSGMAGSEDNSHPAAFANAPLEEASGRLLAIMRNVRPQVVVTYDEDGEGGYGHPDHVMANRVAVEAFQRAQGEPWASKKLYYMASSKEASARYVERLDQLGLKLPWAGEEDVPAEWGIPEVQITTRVDVRRWAHLKKRALEAHRTQIPADFFYLAIPDEDLRETSGVEYFVRVQPLAQPGELEEDLFDGLEDSTAAA